MARLFPKDNADFQVKISTQSIVKLIAIFALAVVAFGLLQKMSHVLGLIGIAFFFSLALNTPIKWVAKNLPKRKKDNRALAIGITMAVVVALLIGFLVSVLPPLSKQTVSIIKDVPSLVEGTQTGVGPIGRFVQTYNLQDQVETLSEELSSRVGNIGSSAISTVGRVGSSVISLLTVIVLTIMMLAEGPKWTRLSRQLIATKHRGHVESLVIEMNKVVQGYVNGQVVLALAAAVLIAPMFFILDISYPLALVGIVFICGLIPMVGHTIGAVIVTFVALFTSLPAALIILSYYILYQQIENYAVQPRVQANTTNMSPLLVFVALLLGGSIGGLLGAIVAIPVMGCIRILVLDFIKRRDVLPSSKIKSA
jgi:predicted PurR-regulated permease PerM